MIVDAKLYLHFFWPDWVFYHETPETLINCIEIYFFCFVLIFFIFSVCVLVVGVGVWIQISVLV